MRIALVFTGHMTDLPDRKEPRFPPPLEGAARTAIGAELDRQKARGIAGGFASGARGGDILFHEECRKRGVATTIVLPFAPEEFAKTSIEGADGDWLRRFRRLWDETPAQRRLVLKLPVTDDAFGICNTRLLELARRQGPIHLIALWDGQRRRPWWHRRHGESGRRRRRSPAYHRAAGLAALLAGAGSKALEALEKRRRVGGPDKVRDALL